MKKYMLFLAVPIVLSANQPTANAPFGAMEQMQREMEAAMAKFREQMVKVQGAGSFASLNANMSAVGLKTVGDHYELTMALPGASEKNIGIKDENHIVTVTAECEEVHDRNASGQVWQERSASRYVSSAAVPKDADTEHMKTDYKDGLLTITMPKKKGMALNQTQ